MSWINVTFVIYLDSKPLSIRSANTVVFQNAATLGTTREPKFGFPPLHLTSTTEFKTYSNKNTLLDHTNNYQVKIANWSTSQSSFDLVQYYRDMCVRLSHTLELLTNFMYSTVHFKWTDFKQKMFEKINQIAAYKNLLSYKNFNKKLKYVPIIDTSN